MRVTAVLATVLAAAITVGVAQAVTPGRNGLIYFHNFDETSESADIFSVSPNGSGLRDLTRDSTAGELEPTLSPSRAQIAFLSDRGAGDNFHLFVMNANGDGQHALGGGGISHAAPAWSPNSRQIAFSRCVHVDEDTNECDRAHIAVVNADGSNLRFLTSPSVTTVDSRPAWAPNGNSLVFERMDAEGKFSLWSINPNTARGLRRIVNDGSTIEMAPSYAPNGKRIAYSSDAVGGRETIFTVTTAGKSRVRVLQESILADGTGEGVENPVYSPDGTRIAFTADGDVWSVGVNGRNRDQVTKDGGDEADWGRG